MSHRILHFFSSDFISGATMYAIRIAEKQTEEGNKVFIVTDSSNLPSKLPITTLAVANRSYKQRIKNILFLRQFIFKNNITIVHAHSRAASWVAYIACKMCRIPLVSTIHGRQFKPDDKYGEYIIGICPNIMEHLKTELKFDASKLFLIPNGIDLSNFKDYKSNKNESQFVISVVGRFNGPKGRNIASLLTDIFPNLLQEFPHLYINLFGCAWESFPDEAKNCYQDLHQQYNDRILNLGFNDKVLYKIINSDLIIGSGRVAIEALSLGITTMAIGEGCYHGILTKNNIDAAKASNFGDIMPTKSDFHPDCNLILNDIRNYIINPVKHVLNDDISIYELNSINDKIEEVYRKAIIKKFHPKHIPILMYHKVPDEPINSQHKTFVTKDNFKKHLQFFKFRGLKAITFKEYQDFASEKKTIKEFPRKAFIITFDDGYTDNFTNMLPLTNQYGYKGVLFLLGDFNATANFWDKGEDEATSRLMTTDQKKAFVDNGWEIAAHSITHRDMSLLTDQEIIEELTESRRIIEETLDTEIISFAYPFGTINNRLKELTKSAGYSYGISTDSGGMTIDEDPFEIFRVNIFPNESILQLYKKTSTWYRTYYKKKRGK